MDVLYWIWLTQIKRVGPVLQKALLEEFITPENIYKASYPDLLQCEGIGETIAKRIAMNKSLDKAECILNHVNRAGIKVLTFRDYLYPTEVKNIKETPVVLYYKGELVKNSTGVAIVGSRRCSEYGKRVTKDAASYLAKENICLVSGMAKGIDSYAHTAVIKAGGYTIAVLGHGLDICYPAEHKELLDKIIKNGTVVSEYPPGVKPEPMHFPRRNLLISCWSHKILVVEAGEKSGALLTANYGKKYGRGILAVPDNIYRKESIGSNRLIKDGAAPYFNEKQLLIKNKYKPKRKSLEKEVSEESVSDDMDMIEKSVIETLKAKGQRTVVDLSVLMKIDKMELLEKISLMELEGKIIIHGAVAKLPEKVTIKA
jgi:DNA processing protein